MKYLTNFILIFLLMGCQTVAQTTRNALPNTIASKLILNGELIYTKVQDLRMDANGKFLKVEAELYNISSNDDLIYYKFYWYNNTGLLVGPKESWKTIPIRSQAKQMVTGVSTSADAVDFKLEIQSPNNTGIN